MKRKKTDAQSMDLFLLFSLQPAVDPWGGGGGGGGGGRTPGGVPHFCYFPPCCYVSLLGIHCNYIFLLAVNFGWIRVDK